MEGNGRVADALAISSDSHRGRLDLARYLALLYGLLVFVEFEGDFSTRILCAPLEPDDEGNAGADALASGELNACEGLQDAGLSAGLVPNHYNGGQLDSFFHDVQVPELVNGVEQRTDLLLMRDTEAQRLGVFHFVHTLKAFHVVPTLKLDYGFFVRVSHGHGHLHCLA